MAFAFDTLAIARKLEAANVPREQAEAMAGVLRDHVMPDLATKADVKALEALVTATADKVTIRLGGLVVVVAGLALTFLRLFPAH